MDIFQIRNLLKSGSFSIYDLNLRVTNYGRVSTDKEEQKNSLGNQYRFFESFISGNNNWEYVEGYSDEGKTGLSTNKRDDFNRMIADAKAGKFDLIITKEISRFARNTLDSIQFTRELLRYGVAVFFYADNINTLDDDAELRLTIMASLAQDELRKLSSRIKFGHSQSIKKGRVLGNSRLYGYDKKDCKLYINEKQAEMVQLIFSLYASGDYSTNKIEQVLYDKGYRNYKNGKISSSVIKNIIVNPNYKGYFAGGKVQVVDMFTKEQKFIDEEDWVLFKDEVNVPAIVDEALWEAVNKIYRARSEDVKSRRSSIKTHNLYTGKIFCSNTKPLFI